MRRFKNPKLAAALARSGLTSREVARRAGLHYVTLSSILNNRVVPKPDTVEAISRVLDASSEELGLEEGGNRHD